MSNKITITLIALALTSIITQTSAQATSTAKPAVTTVPPTAAPTVPSTAAPTVPSTAAPTVPSTAAPTVPSTAPPTTVAPATTAKATLPPTTAAPVTTSIPVEVIPSKAELISRAADLDKLAVQVVEKLRTEGRTALAPELDQIRNNVRDTADKLGKATNPDIISLLSAELVYIEKFLSVELEVLIALDEQVQHLLDLATALEKRIEAGIKVLGNTAIGKALQGEGERLQSVMDALKKAKDGPSIQEVEMQLVDIITQVNLELGPINVPTVPSIV